MKKLDIVIATYRRVERAFKLANSLVLIGKQLINKIYIVDSTENSRIIEDSEFIVHIQTDRKNQPFQRYLGFLKSSSEIILFLDDDMEIADENCLSLILNHFSLCNISGLAICFEDKHKETSLSAIPQSQLFKNNGYLKRSVNWLTGYPQISEGRLGLCGIRGNQPHSLGYTEFIGGGAFAARRSSLYQNFNMQLFELYDTKIGKGEDAILGYTLSKIGLIRYDPKLLFYHVDKKDSSYSIDHVSFSKRVVFSRLYLSLEKARLDNTSLFYAVLFYQWHTLWRVIGLLANYLIKPSKTQLNLIIGAFLGWRESFRFKFNPMTYRTTQA